MLLSMIEFGAEHANQIEIGLITLFGFVSGLALLATKPNNHSKEDTK